MKLAALFSGGKDSTFALYKMLKEGHEIKYLLTIIPESRESWMFHHPCIELTKLQAKTMGIPQLIRRTKGEKEKELEDLKELIKKVSKEVEGIVTGAVESSYQKSRIDKICDEFELISIAPLWKKDSLSLLKEELREGFEIIISGVFAEGFDISWIGRKIDEKCIEDLIELNKKFKIHIAGEGGEYETLVLDCPIFKQKIEINGEEVWDKKTNSGYLVVRRAKLKNKN